MLKNVPVQKLRHGELTIEGYSRAAVQTYWRIAELKVGFDLGAHPWDFMGTPTWMISHVHLDHIAALPLYVARRREQSQRKTHDAAVAAARQGFYRDQASVVDRGLSRE